MEPSLIRNDRILVQKVSYWFGGEPQRGDVVVFQDPGGWLTDAEAAGPDNAVAKAMAAVGLYPEGGHLVKRVIGVAGDTINCCDDKGRISVNGLPLNEDAYIREQGTRCTARWSPTATGRPVRSPRATSSSWATTGPTPPTPRCTWPRRETDCVPGDEFVPADLVVGKVLVLLWPLHGSTGRSSRDVRGRARRS